VCSIEGAAVRSERAEYRLPPLDLTGRIAVQSCRQRGKKKKKTQTERTRGEKGLKGTHKAKNIKQHSMYEDRVLKARDLSVFERPEGLSTHNDPVHKNSPTRILGKLITATEKGRYGLEKGENERTRIRKRKKLEGLARSAFRPIFPEKGKN